MTTIPGSTASWLMPIEAVRATLSLHGWIGLKETDDDTPNYQDGGRPCLKCIYNFDRSYRVSYNTLTRLYQINHHARPITFGLHWKEIPIADIPTKLLTSFYYKLLEADKL